MTCCKDKGRLSRVNNKGHSVSNVGKTETPIQEYCLNI